MPEINPLVSIILPTFNGSRYIRQAIESCLGQDYVHIELIVIDDGSLDDTPTLVQSFKDQRLRYFRLDKNGGHIAALNQGFALSRGEYLTWTSDDNYYAKDAIGKMLEELQGSRVNFVYSRYNVIDENGNILRQGRTEDPSYLDIDNCVGGCFLYRREVYAKVGDFNKDAFLAEDYEYWLRVRARFKMKKMDEILYFYRYHPESLTGVHQDRQVQEQVQKIRNQFLPWWKKTYFYCMNQVRRYVRHCRVLFKRS